MKLTINRKIISLFLASILTMSAIAIPVYATEPDATEEQSQEVETIEVLDTTIPLEFDEENDFEVFDWEKYYDPLTSEIDANQFITAGDNVYPLTISVAVIEGFDEDCYIQLIESEHQNIKIKVDLTAQEGFTKTVYLPEGVYQVFKTGVKNAETLTFTEDISLAVLGKDSQEDVEINLVLNNAESIVKNELGEWQDVSSENQIQHNNSTKLYKIEALSSVQTDVSGVFYYSVDHLGRKNVRLVEKEVQTEKDGQTIIEIQQVEEIYYEEQGLGYVTVYGNAKADADVVLEITKAGVIGQAEFKVSYDGGTTFVAKYYTGESVSDSRIGLVYNFYMLNDTDEFTEGDRFTFHSIESFKISKSSGNEKSRITCVGHPLKDHELVIRILSSGGRGISRIKITDEKGNSETKIYLIPEDGILTIDDNLTIYFEDIDGYVKDVSYNIEVTSHNTTIDYTPLIILGIIVAILLFIALIWLLMKKDKRGNYIVHQYEWKQDESAYK